MGVSAFCTKIGFILEFFFIVSLAYHLCFGMDTGVDDILMDGARPDSSCRLGNKSSPLLTSVPGIFMCQFVSYLYAHMHL